MLFETLSVKASDAAAPFSEVIVAARAIADHWRAQRPALLRKAEALASIVDALIHSNLSRIVDFGTLEREISAWLCRRSRSGRMQFVNIAFSIACVLPFDEREARFRFSFCDR
jgi:hypothetical protein